jgi:predicted ATPase with chaperone activity
MPPWITGPDLAGGLRASIEACRNTASSASPRRSVKEGATRIQSALKAVGYDLPLKKVTINLAPADLRKPGCGLDLSIALAVLVAEGVIEEAALADLLVLGELGLDGTVRSVRGVLAAAMLARANRMRGIVIPDPCAAEAEVVDDLAVRPVRHLGELIGGLRGEQPLRIPSPAARPYRAAPPSTWPRSAARTSRAPPSKWPSRAVITSCLPDRLGLENP